MYAVPNMAVFRSSFRALPIFCSGLNDFEMVPLAPTLTGITFAFTFHTRSIIIIIIIIIIINGNSAMCRHNRRTVNVTSDAFQS